MMTASDVLSFWFTELKPKQWFYKDDSVDQLIRTRFLSTLEAAALGELAAWRAVAEGRLAEILVLDQFSRNIFRGTARAFTQDPLASRLAEEAVDLKLDASLTLQQKP